MQAELKRLHSPDIENLAAFAPADSAKFGFLLQVMAGPMGSEGEESFDLVVCTPQWLQGILRPDSLTLGRHYLIVLEYNYQRLRDFLETYCSECTGSTWQGIAERLGRLGKWEFEDYKSPKDT